MKNSLRLAVLILIGGIVSCTTPLPPEATQRAMFDNQVANYLISTTTDLVRRYIPGAQRGSVNLNVPCRDGGSAAITGTITEAATGVVTRDLTFVMDNCISVDSTVFSYGTTMRSLRVTGTMKRNADFGTAFIKGAYEAAAPLDINGTLHVVINSITSLDPVISESCAFAAADEPARTTGTYCGRTFSY